MDFVLLVRSRELRLSSISLFLLGNLIFVIDFFFFFTFDQNLQIFNRHLFQFFFLFLFLFLLILLIFDDFLILERFLVLLKLKVPNNLFSLDLKFLVQLIV